MLCAKTLKAAKAALIIILGAWATMSAHAQMNLSGGPHAPAVYAAETVSTKDYTTLVATNEAFMVEAWSDVTLAGDTMYHFRYDLTGDTGMAAFGSGAKFRIGDDNETPGEDPARFRPQNLVFSAMAGEKGIERADFADGKLTNEPTDLVLMLDGEHPMAEDGSGMMESAVRPAEVVVRGGASTGTYKFMLRLRIYGALSDALSAGGSMLYDSGPVPIIAIDPTLSATVKPASGLVADVLHNYTKFQDGTKGTTSGKLATVSLDVKGTHCSGYKPGVFPPACQHEPWPIMPAGADGDGEMVELGDVMSSGGLSVRGDHSLVKLMLGTGTLTLRDAAGKALETHKEGENKGEYVDRSLAVDAHIALKAEGAMDLTANVGDMNTSPIPTGSYTASVALTPANADAAPVAGVTDSPAGTIDTNGTMVHLGYLTGHDGYNQRVIIANRGKVEVSYVLSNILTEDGTAATAGHAAAGMVPAESQVVVRTVDLISFDSGMSRASATLSLSAPTSAISVSTTIVNLGDGSTDTSTHIVQ